jgi:hypothetical protein
VLAVLAVIIVGKALLSFLLVVALRYPLRIALGVAASLAQIGEFSFILAGLGATYGLMTQEGRDLVWPARSCRSCSIRLPSRRRFCSRGGCRGVGRRRWLISGRRARRHWSRSLTGFAR